MFALQYDSQIEETTCWNAVASCSGVVLVEFYLDLAEFDVLSVYSDGVLVDSLQGTAQIAARYASNKSAFTFHLFAPQAQRGLSHFAATARCVPISIPQKAEQHQECQVAEKGYAVARSFLGFPAHDFRCYEVVCSAVIITLDIQLGEQTLQIVDGESNEVVKSFTGVLSERFSLSFNSTFYVRVSNPDGVRGHHYNISWECPDLTPPTLTPSIGNVNTPSPPTASPPSFAPPSFSPTSPSSPAPAPTPPSVNCFVFAPGGGGGNLSQDVTTADALCWEMQCPSRHTMVVQYVVALLRDQSVALNSFVITGYRSEKVVFTEGTLSVVYRPGYVDSVLKTSFSLQWACEDQANTPAPTSGRDGGCTSIAVGDQSGSRRVYLDHGQNIVERQCWSTQCSLPGDTFELSAVIAGHISLFVLKDNNIHEHFDEPSTGTQRNWPSQGSIFTMEINSTGESGSVWFGWRCFLERTPFPDTLTPPAPKPYSWCSIDEDCRTLGDTTASCSATKCICTERSPHSNPIHEGEVNYICVDTTVRPMTLWFEWGAVSSAESGDSSSCATLTAFFIENEAKIRDAVQADTPDATPSVSCTDVNGGHIVTLQAKQSLHQVNILRLEERFAEVPGTEALPPLAGAGVTQVDEGSCRGDGILHAAKTSGGCVSLECQNGYSLESGQCVAPSTANPTGVPTPATTAIPTGSGTVSPEEETSGGSVNIAVIVGAIVGSVVLIVLVVVGVVCVCKRRGRGKGEKAKQSVAKDLESHEPTSDLSKVKGLGGGDNVKEI